MREAGLKKLAAQPGERILEVGFGTGHCLVEIGKAVGPDGQVLGIDISDRMMEHAKDLLQHEGLIDRAELICGDAVQLPYESGTIDGIFFSFTLELFDTPEIPKVLAECKRVLKQNGRIVVVAVSKLGEGGIVLRAFEWMAPRLLFDDQQQAGSVVDHGVSDRRGKTFDDFSHVAHAKRRPAAEADERVSDIRGLDSQRLLVQIDSDVLHRRTASVKLVKLSHLLFAALTVAGVHAQTESRVRTVSGS